MKAKLLSLASVILVVAIVGGVLLMQRSHERLIQTLAIPSYFAPGPYWTQLIDSAPRVGVAIINPSNGPGGAINPDYLAQVQAGKMQGVAILGYVATGHGQRDERDVRREIDAYFMWYRVDGIFFDQASTDCASLPFYNRLRADVKAKDDNALTVLNPGMLTDECFMNVADIVVTFENTYRVYISEYRAPNWIKKYDANRFWHLVYDAPSPVEMHNAVALSKQRRAGRIYVTPATVPNPWSVLPDDLYWHAELEALK